MSTARTTATSTATTAIGTEMAVLLPLLLPAEPVLRAVPPLLALFSALWFFRLRVLPPALAVGNTCFAV